MPDAPAEPPLEVLLERVGAAVGRHRRRVAAAHGLTPTALAVLAALDGVGAGGPVGGRGDPARAPSDHDPAGAPSHHDQNRAPSHRELAGRLGLSPATLTPVLDALETTGAVRRQRDRTDRRVVRVHRTPAGRARLARAPSARLPQPDPDVEAAVRAWLRTVLAAAEAPR
jgi:DNA-binding MarR family transcriptional regulator